MWRRTCKLRSQLSWKSIAPIFTGLNPVEALIQFFWGSFCLNWAGGGGVGGHGEDHGNALPTANTFIYSFAKALN